MANGAQFSKYKVWNDEKLTDTDLNAAIDRIYENLDALGLGSRDTTSVHARETADPGTYASPNVAVTIQDQIHHLRYLIGQIIGGDNESHLDTIPTTLETLSTSGASLAFSLDFEGALEGASSTTDAYARLINKGAIINAFSQTLADVTAADFNSANTKFGKYSYEMAAGNVLAYPGFMTNPVKGSVGAWVKGMTSNQHIAYNPLLGIELYIDGSSKLAAKITGKTAATESTKTVNTVTGDDEANYVTDMAAAFKHVSLGYALNDVDGASEDQLKISWDGVFDSSVNLTGQNIDINHGDGGVWFIGASPQNPTLGSSSGWDHVYAATGLPDAHSSSVWSAADITGTPTVSNGVLTIDKVSGTALNRYTNASLVDLSNQTLEWKVRLPDIKDGTPLPPSLVGCGVLIRDASMAREVEFEYHTDRVVIRAGNDTLIGTVDIDTTKWHTYRLTSEGTPNPAIKLYVDGVLVYGSSLVVTESTANDQILFGDFSNTSGANAVSEWEYFKISNQEAVAPIAANSQGYIDDFANVKQVLSDVLLAALQNASAESVFGTSGSYGPYNMVSGGSGNQAIIGVATTFTKILGNAVLWLAGDGVTRYELSAHVITDLPTFTDITNSGVYAAIGIDDDIAGLSQPSPMINHLIYGYERTAAGLDEFFDVHRFGILSPGLHEIRVFAHDESTAVGRCGVYHMQAIKIDNPKL